MAVGEEVRIKTQMGLDPVEEREREMGVMLGFAEDLEEERWG